jgi:hypothetical protein
VDSSISSRPTSKAPCRGPNGVVRSRGPRCILYKLTCSTCFFLALFLLLGASKHTHRPRLGPAYDDLEPFNLDSRNRPTRGRRENVHVESCPFYVTPTLTRGKSKEWRLLSEDGQPRTDRMPSRKGGLFVNRGIGRRGRGKKQGRRLQLALTSRRGSSPSWTSCPLSGCFVYNYPT